MRQNVLEANPSAKLKVYAVWMPMLATDARSEIDTRVFDDARVEQLWDGERALGTWLADPANVELDYPGPVVWDAYLLFGPDADWGEGRPPTRLLASGWTVIGTTDRLESALRPLLADAA